MTAVSKFTHLDANVYLGVSCPDLFYREWIKTDKSRTGFHPSLKKPFEINSSVNDALTVPVPLQWL